MQPPSHIPGFHQSGTLTRIGAIAPARADRRASGGSTSAQRAPSAALISRQTWLQAHRQVVPFHRSARVRIAARPWVKPESDQRSERLKRGGVGGSVYRRCSARMIAGSADWLSPSLTRQKLFGAPLRS